MFRSLLAHPQEVLHKRNLVSNMCVYVPSNTTVILDGFYYTPFGAVFFFPCSCAADLTVRLSGSMSYSCWGLAVSRIWWCLCLRMVLHSSYVLCAGTCILVSTTQRKMVYGNVKIGTWCIACVLSVGCTGIGVECTASWGRASNARNMQRPLILNKMNKKRITLVALYWYNMMHGHWVLRVTYKNTSSNCIHTSTEVL
jgi:hypothetical protein